MDRREFLLGSALAALPAFAKSGAPYGSPESHAGRIRIAHLTDPQFGFDWTPQDNEAKYAADLARFESAVARVNDIKPDLVLITGDMTHKAEDLARDWPRLLGMFKVPVVVAADMLQGDHKLEYRKFDVSYDFHFDKLYEYNPAPNAPLRETTL